MGTESAAARAIADSVGRQLGAEEPAAPKRRGPEGDDNDDAGRSYLEERW